MSTILDPPSQLFFERPLTISAAETLTITNSENQPIAFKVKTTSPKQYCVRPNSGKIEPGDKIEVQILLQPFKEEPPIDFKCKDKFLVQTAIIPPEKVDLPTGQLWSLLEQADKQSIKEKKLRCVFLPPNEGGSVNDARNLEATVSSPVASYQEVPPNYGTAREVPTIKRQPEDIKNLLSDDFIRSNLSSGPSASETPSNQAQEELEQAKSTISQLEKEVEALKAKIKAANESPMSSPQPASVALRNGNSTNSASSDINVQSLGVVAFVAFILGWWLG